MKSAARSGPSRRAALSRRELVRSMLGLGLACGCGTSVSPRDVAPESLTAVGPPAQRPSHGAPVTLLTWFDLPVDPRSRELSGIAWDDAARTLWAVQDDPARIVALLPDAQLARWRFGRSIPLDLPFPIDLEGIVVVPNGFVVASEKGPHIVEVDAVGKLRREIVLPAHFAQFRENKSLESLSLSPDGAYLFTTSEAALSFDGPTPTSALGTHVRILRQSLAGNEIEEHAYLTDPLPHSEGGDYGVADLAAVSRTEVLVLERGWTRGFGNTARIYRVNLTDGPSVCTANPALAADSAVLAKRLIVDLKTLTTTGLPVPEEPQASPLLDNYEGMAFGPLLSDGRRCLILISDDNRRAEQRARIIVLALG